MASQSEISNMALFCDFENVALGVRDAKYAQFDIRRVLERLLLKGSIVVKKAYCDWERYKEFKATMHEAAFELIEIPHVRQSGKNSADIRLVVDALDLCYTKAHVDTFVIISGDSDFSPLVSKLRENDKYVIGIGVKDSTSDLLSANCDEFIFYDDLVHEQEAKQKRKARKAPAKASTGKKVEVASEDSKRQEALDFIVETVEALTAERGMDEKIWGSLVKTTMQRRRPGFTESSYGYRSFKELVEDAQKHKLLTVVRDDKSSQYSIRLP
ncbi:MAG TPA: NYN domain-containing protein [Gallionellaceae bacterium]